MTQKQNITDALQEILVQFKLTGINKNLIELQFLKNAQVHENGEVFLEVELRAPHTKNRDFIQSQLFEKINAIAGVSKVHLNIWDYVAPAPKTSEGPNLEFLKDVKWIVAVASGKGGVGKSTVTANLAMSLSLAGLRVGIMDTDIYGPSMNMMFGINQAPQVNPDRTVFPVTTKGGIKVVSMAMFAESDQAVIWRGPMASQMVQNFVTRVHWGKLDVLLIDTPPGTGDIQLTLTQTCPIKGAVIVTTPQNVSLIDVRRGLQMFDNVSVPILGVVENMSYFIDPTGQKHHLFGQGGGERISRQLGLSFLGEIGIDPAVSAGGDEGMPITYTNPNSLVSKSFENISLQILDQLKSQNESGLSEYQLKWDDIPSENI